MTPRPLPVARPAEWALPAPTQRLSECPACGSLRYGSGPHSPHRNAAGQLVDCVGQPVEVGP